MLSRQILVDMCRLSTLAYRENGFISDIFDNFKQSRPFTNEFCVLDNCNTCPSLIHGDLSNINSIIQNDCQAYACRYQDSLAIVFRGTESFRDVLTDLNMIRVNMDLPNVADTDRPKVHWGFLRQFRTVESQVRKHIDTFMKDCDQKCDQQNKKYDDKNHDKGVGVGLTNKNLVTIYENKQKDDDLKDNDLKDNNLKDYHLEKCDESRDCQDCDEHCDEKQSLIKKSPIKHVIFSGHSLGGALATIAAVQFAKQYPDIVVSCVTFGSPRVGNTTFVSMFDQCCTGSYRFVNEDDPVPMGPTPIRFRHVKGGRWIDDEQLLLQKPWMRSLTFFKNLFLSFIGFTHNPVSDHGCVGYLNFISTMR